MASEVESDKKSTFNIKAVLGYMGWAIIYTAIIAGAGFYYGAQSQAKAQADIKAAVEQATAPAPQAPVSLQ